MMVINEEVDDFGVDENRDVEVVDSNCTKIWFSGRMISYVNHHVIISLCLKSPTAKSPLLF